MTTMCEALFASAWLVEPCLTVMWTGGVFYVFALAILLVIISAWLMRLEALQPLVRPFLNELWLAEYLLFVRYYHRVPDRVRDAWAVQFGYQPNKSDYDAFTEAEVQNAWSLIGKGIIAQAMILFAFIFPLLLMAR